MKIVLAGGYDTKNLGDHASLEVFQRDLRVLDPSLEITLLSRHPDKKFDKIYNIKSILNLDHNNKKDSLGRWFNGLNPGDSTDHLQLIWKELESADLLVIGNGRLFIDITLDFLRGPLPYYALLVTLAKFLNVPIMIFSMTIVPVRTEIGRILLNYIISNANIITVREESSKEELLDYNIPHDKIKVIPDAAFGLDYSDRRSRGTDILKKEKIDIRKKKFIGVNFRYTHLDTPIQQDYYFNVLAELCDELYLRTGLDILMISQMTYNIDNPLNDDRELYKLIHKNCKFNEHIHIIEGDYHLKDTLSLYQCCEMLYTMRRHGAIFAATQRVPFFAISGERNTSYAVNEMDLNENQIKLSELLADKGFEKMINAYNNREAIKKNYNKLSQLARDTKEYATIAFSFSK